MTFIQLQNQGLQYFQSLSISYKKTFYEVKLLTNILHFAVQKERFSKTRCYPFKITSIAQKFQNCSFNWYIKTGFTQIRICATDAIYSAM